MGDRWVFNLPRCRCAGEGIKKQDGRVKEETKETCRSFCSSARRAVKERCVRVAKEGQHA